MRARRCLFSRAAVPSGGYLLCSDSSETKTEIHERFICRVTHGMKEKNRNGIETGETAACPAVQLRPVFIRDSGVLGVCFIKFRIVLTIYRIQESDGQTMNHFLRFF